MFDNFTPNKFQLKTTEIVNFGISGHKIKEAINKNTALKWNKII